MLNSYSPKQLKSYLSNSNLNHYMNDSSYVKNQKKYSNPFQKKSTSPQNYPAATIQNTSKSNLQKSSKSARKLLLKSGSEKKYLVNYTTSGTPFEKSTMLSYVSTPN